MNAITGVWDAFSSFSTELTRLMSTTDAVVPPMAWEAAASQALDISFGQMRFVVALFLAIPLNAVMRGIKAPWARQLYSIAIGLLLVIYPFGRGVIQVVFPIVFTYLAMLLAPRRCTMLAWIVNFGYLIWLQIITASGLSWNKGEIDFVGAIMVLTLKLISLAACYQDSFVKDKGALSPYQREHLISRVPSPLAYLSYVFALGNLLAGPPIEFSEFNHFIEHGPGFDRVSGPATGVAHGLFWTLQGLGFMGLHILLISKMGWGITDNLWFRRQPYTSLPLAARLGCQVVCGFAHQIKYYFLWKLAEAAMVFSGFDFVGWGENGKPLWGRCTNVRFLGMWLSESARIVPQHWNIRTGIFLKRYVYERLAGPGVKAGFTHVLLTQLVTAFWHGVYPGYLIFFVGTVFYLQAASVIYRSEQILLPQWLVSSWPWWLIKVAWTDIAVCYMSMAFVILDGSLALEMHRDVAFLPHIIMLVLCALGLLLPSRKSKLEKQ